MSNNAASFLLQRNMKSALYQKYLQEANKDMFKYKLDPSAPPADFIVSKMRPTPPPQGQNAQLLRIPIKRQGLMGKMLLKWTFTNPGGGEMYNALTGLNIIEEVSLVGVDGPIETINTEVIFQRIEELQNTNAHDIMESMYGVNGSVTYTPLLFNFSSSINNFIDTLYMGQLHLEVKMRNFSKFTGGVIGPNLGVECELQADYLHLTEMDIKDMFQSYPVTKSLLNCVQEKPIVVSAGKHDVVLDNSGLARRIYVALKNEGDLTYQLLRSIQVRVSGDVLFDMNVAENHYFNKGYLGVSSDVYAAKTSNIFVIGFDIPSRTNGNLGCLSINEGDAKEDVIITVDTGASDGTLYITEEFYTLKKFQKSGFVRDEMLLGQTVPSKVHKVPVKKKIVTVKKVKPVKPIDGNVPEAVKCPDQADPVDVKPVVKTEGTGAAM
jgi:hypothetical protein